MIKEEKQVTTQTIDASLLARMFLAGAKNLDAKKEWINELNVFPVPDGDTGTNMSMTISTTNRYSELSCASWNSSMEYGTEVLMKYPLSPKYVVE